MPTDESADMARRALLTEAERDHIRGEKENKQRTWEAISRIRSRIQNQMNEDVKILQEYRPDLLEELREVVCNPTLSELLEEETEEVPELPESVRGKDREEILKMELGELPVEEVRQVTRWIIEQRQAAIRAKKQIDDNTDE